MEQVSAVKRPCQPARASRQRHPIIRLQIDAAGEPTGYVLVGLDEVAAAGKGVPAQ
jgi:hypothetical protein